MRKHLSSLWSILLWSHILDVFYGSRWWQVWWGEYAPYTRCQKLGLPMSLAGYYDDNWFHTNLVKNRFFSIFLNGSFCHIEIELYFTPEWRTLQFFIKAQPYKDLNAHRLPDEPIKKTTWGRSFNTFTNRRGY